MDRPCPPNLIARFCGEGEARRIARIFLLGDRRDGQLPFAAMVRPQQLGGGTIAPVQDWIAKQDPVPNPVAKIAENSGPAPRTFKRGLLELSTGVTPRHYRLQFCSNWLSASAISRSLRLPRSGVTAAESEFPRANLTRFDLDHCFLANT